MKIANILSTFLITLNFLSLATETANASYDDYQRFRKGTYDFEVETQYFKTDANYLSAGDRFQALLYGQSYDIYNVYLKTRYDLSRRSSWYGHLNIANATSHGFDATRVNSSVSDAKVGYAYRPYSESFDMITDFNVVIPFYKISVNTDSSLNGEGVIEATGLLRLQKEFDPLLIFGYLGATLRQSRSALVPWGAGLEFSYPRWSLGGKIFGHQSVTDDPDTGDQTQRLIVINRVNASSFKFYSINPSIVDSEVYAKIKFRKAWTVAGGVGTTITGSNAAAGMHAGLSLMYSWDSEPRYFMKSGSQDDGISSEKKVPKFKEEIDDGVDQNLFQKKAPPAPQPRPGSDLTPANENVAIKRISPKPAPTPEYVPDGGEVQLKLKKKKKRRS